MRKWFLLWGVVALALALSAGPAWAQTGISRADLQAQNNSGETGQALLSSVDAMHTQIEIKLDNAGGMDQPAHIHAGTCANLDPKPAIPLNNVVNGYSLTVVNRPITDLLGGRYAVNVHKSAAEINTYVACGDLTALMNGGVAPGGSTNPGGGSGPGMPVTGQESLWGFAALALAAGGMLALVGVILSRRLA